MPQSASRPRVVLRARALVALGLRDVEVVVELATERVHPISCAWDGSFANGACDPDQSFSDQDDDERSAGVTVVTSSYYV